MRIAIDVSPLSHPRSGIGNYLRGWLHGLSAVAGDRHQIVCFGPTSPRGKRRIQVALDGVVGQRSLLTLPFSHHARQGWSRLGRPALERFIGRFDVLHYSDWMYPPQRDGVRATTIYDLVPIRFPEWATKRTIEMHTRKYRHTAARCEMVFAISECTARDVEELLGIGRERITVAYPGVDPRFTPDGPAPAAPRRYLLAVSTHEPRKGLDLLVRAFPAVRERFPEVELVLAGGEGWGEGLDARAGGVVTPGYVSDDELAALYRGAAAFVYPSRFEGFGLPIVEAMASGAPVIASAHPSLDEACGNVAARVDVADTDALVDSLTRTLETGDHDPAPGVAHASNFTWERCAHAVPRGYEAAR